VAGKLLNETSLRDDTHIHTDTFKIGRFSWCQLYQVHDGIPRSVFIGKMSSSSPNWMNVIEMLSDDDMHPTRPCRYPTWNGTQYIISGNQVLDVLDKMSPRYVRKLNRISALRPYGCGKQILQSGDFVF
jgi:hypothetical protein